MRCVELSRLAVFLFYKALDEKAHPRFETIFKVLNAMGIQMTLVPKVKFRKCSKQTELCVAEKRARYKA